MKKIKDVKEKIEWPKKWGDISYVSLLTEILNDKNFFDDMFEEAYIKRLEKAEDYASKFKKKRWYEEK